MSCPEIDLMRRQVCARLHGTVATWQWDLQSRYGDPRVYALQQAQMNRVDAEVAHDMSRRNSALLTEAYDKQKAKARDSHRTRIAATREKLKTRGRQSSATLPESAADQPRTPPPPDALPPAQSSAS